MSSSPAVEGPSAAVALLDRLPQSQEEYDATEKKLIRKVDFRLMPPLIGMIVLNYLDRNALPNARVQGIEDDLGLHGNQFNIAISVLFAGYLALQIPSNLILTRVRPSIYLPVCMALWGTVSACTALVKDFKGLVICRFFLGFLEAPFFPGALFLLSAWYTPRELATRTAVMYTGSMLSSGFGGLIGAGIQYGMDGLHGLHSWQWLFLIEGCVTVGLSLSSILLLPDFPATTKWLTEEEKAVAIHRLHKYSGSEDEERGSLFKGLVDAATDYKVWLLTLIVILKTSAGAVTAFIPTLVRTFNFGKVQTLLLTAPPYVFAAIVAMGVSISSDKRQERYLHLVIPLVFGAIGYIIAAATETELVPASAPATGPKPTSIAVAAAAPADVEMGYRRRVLDRDCPLPLYLRHLLAHNASTALIPAYCPLPASPRAAVQDSEGTAAISTVSQAVCAVEPGTSYHVQKFKYFNEDSSLDLSNDE